MKNEPLRLFNNGRATGKVHRCNITQICHCLVPQNPKFFPCCGYYCLACNGRINDDKHRRRADNTPKTKQGVRNLDLIGPKPLTGHRARNTSIDDLPKCMHPWTKTDLIHDDYEVWEVIVCGVCDEKIY
jgi:hypothetical protein